MPRKEIRKNYEIFKEKLDDLLTEHSGKFVVLHNQEVQEFFNSFEDAWKWGPNKFKLETFIIQKVKQDITNFVMKQAI